MGKISMLVLSILSISVLANLNNSVAAEKPPEVEYINSIGMKMNRIEPGTFIMGADSNTLPWELCNLQLFDSSYAVSRLTSPEQWDGFKQGLTGVKFQETGFKSPYQREVISSAALDWNAEKGWSARWRGQVTGPESGKVTISAETTGQIKVVIDSETVIKGGKEKQGLSGQIQMIKGQRMPIILEIEQKKGPAYLRLYWSWQGQEKIIIAPEAISYTVNEHNLTIIDLSWFQSSSHYRSNLRGGDYDEKPRHKVTITQPFYMSETEVTIDQYREFRPDYPGYTEYQPYASAISWYDAVAFCEWLTNKEGKPYRLPTEAEWEYACRAGTNTPFSSGNTPQKNETPNSWGIKNMHTGVLEWCLDWHGLYSEEDQIDSIGPKSGFAKVIRGGSPDVINEETMTHYYNRYYNAWATGKNPYYRRSSNRASMAPSFGPPPKEYHAKQLEDLKFNMGNYVLDYIPGHHNIGFRVVQAPMPKSYPQPNEPPSIQNCVKQSAFGITQGPDPNKPYYKTRKIFPKLFETDGSFIFHEDDNNIVNIGWKIGLPPGYGTRQHTSGLASLPNGDLIAVYYNGFIEKHPDLSLITLRLRYGTGQWDTPCIWPDFLDINDAAPIIWNDNGTIWLIWGCPVLGGGYPFQWTVSKDNGETWSEINFPLFEGPVGGRRRRQPSNNAFRSNDGTIYIGFDGWGGTSGLWASNNNGKTWYDTGGRTLGLHATFVLLDNERILSYGTRNTNIDGLVPKNISNDWGKTWEVSKSPVPKQHSGQRPCMIRLASGRLFYASNFDNTGDSKYVKGFTGRASYVGLSNDNGINWKIRRLYNDEAYDSQGGPIDVRTLGYCSACQSPNGIINLITTRNGTDLHFEFNEAWILQDDDSPSRENEIKRPTRTYRTRGQESARTTIKDDDFMISSTIKEHSETYPSGKLKVTWSAGIGNDGRYLLNGNETWFYENGQKQWEVNYNCGRKIGTETYWSQNGLKKWQKEYKEDGTFTWTIYASDEKIKAKSHWKEDKLLSYELKN